MAGCAIGGWLIAVLAATPADPPPAPSPELIEFLAEFADGDGRFVDPLDAAAALDAPPADTRADAEPATADAARLPEDATDAPPADHR